MKPGDRVHVSAIGGGYEATVLSDEGLDLMVRNAKGRKRLVARKRCRPLDPPQQTRVPLERCPVADLNTLARQLVEHPRWTWQPGMGTTKRIVSTEDTYPHTYPIEPKRDRIPDLDHPATKGWLLHMLREATGTQDACASWLGGEWRLYGWIGASALGRFPTEGAALAAALLAVWTGGAASRRSMSMDDLTRLNTTIRRCAATLLDASYTDGIPTETTDVWRTIAADAARDLTDMIRRLRAAEARTAELEALVNAPELHDFAAGVVHEAAHQRSRWGSEHDAGKAPADWFWLLGYLGGKALAAALAGNTEKALHHCISSAAALANWHAALSGQHTGMRPGIAEPEPPLPTAPEAP